MPLSQEHKLRTRKHIVETARIMFNRHGFDGVSIDDIMKAAGLTRGGFYNHFKNKDALYAEAVSSFLMGRGAEWRAEAGIDPGCPDPDVALNMIEGYLSAGHLGDREGQCPMIALPSDIARASPDVQAAYQKLLEAMISVFESGLMSFGPETRRKSLTLAALCVGGMVLARTLPDSKLADDVRMAAQTSAKEIARS